MDIERVGIVGCGQMGLGIGQVTARAGYATVLLKVTEGPIEQVHDKFTADLTKEVSKGRMSADEQEQLSARLTWTSRVNDLADCDLIIESIVEDMKKKQQLFEGIDEVAKDGAIFASNTSTLCITELMAVAHRVDRFIGLHFFNPVPALKLVEVAPTFATDPAVVETVSRFVERLGKSAVVVRDSAGFIVNCLLVPYLLDAVVAPEKGLGSIADIDSAMQLGAGHPMGPLTLNDFIGLDVVYAMGLNLFAEFQEPRFLPPPLLKRMVLAGYLGRKSGKGFYNYASWPPQPNDWLLGRK